MFSRPPRELRIAFESARLSYSKRAVDLYNSGVNQILSTAAARGHTIFHFRMSDLYEHEDVAYARASLLALPDSWKGDPLDAWQYLQKIDDVTIPLTTLDICFVRGDDIRRWDTPNLDILRKIEDQVTLIENVETTLETCDKFELVKRCPQVPQPVTYAAESLSEALAAVERLQQISNTPYFVLKDRFGYGCGAQVHRFRFDEEGLSSKVHNYLRAYHHLLLQEYCPEVEQGDLVVTFFDGQLLGAMHRRSPKNEWKTNASLGALETKHILTPEQERIARQVQQAFSTCRLASVDMLPSGKVFEINAFPGGKGLLKTHGIALGPLVMDRLEEEQEQKRSSA
ncbi:MAG: hypothetical protein KatS3mg105_1770 [Gemmatales bacterium]|nr:MAG: hypothetical protein KatS3mg105_1770 [Gemmatales bacterium]